MGSKIEWTDETWNPVVGCTRVSRGCDHCYAVRHTRRLAGQLPVYQGLVNPGKGHFNGTVRTIPERLEQPLHWRKPRRVFTCSMSDLFHPNVDEEFIARVFAIMALTPQHTYQVLTKRPERAALVLGALYEQAGLPGSLFISGATVAIQEFLEDELGWRDLSPRLAKIHDDGWKLRFGGNYGVIPNVWLGTSVEDQKRADERIPHLLRTPATVRFLSCEPLLGPVNIQELQVGTTALWPLAGEIEFKGGRKGRHLEPDGYTRCRLHWVIVGGESGPGARPMHPQWARSLRDQCRFAGVPFFFKQWGAWVPEDHFEDYPEAIRESRAWPTAPGRVVRVGKKAAGRMLDGRTWDEFPGGA